MPVFCARQFGTIKIGVEGLAAVFSVSGRMQEFTVFFCRRMGYLSLFLELRWSPLWQPGVADEKKPRKIGFCAWLRGLLECIVNLLFLVCSKFP